MARKRYSDEDILKLLREIEVHIHDIIDSDVPERRSSSPINTQATLKMLDRFLAVRRILSQPNTLENSV